MVAGTVRLPFPLVCEAATAGVAAPFFAFPFPLISSPANEIGASSSSSPTTLPFMEAFAADSFIASFTDCERTTRFLSLSKRSVTAISSAVSLFSNAISSGVSRVRGGGACFFSGSEKGLSLSESGRDDDSR